MHKYILILILIILLLSLLITGCEWGGSYSTMKTCRCEKLPNILPLHIQMGKTFSEEEFKDWINVNYGVPIDKTPSTFDWEKDGVQYRVEMQDSVLVSASVKDVNSPVPSAGCVVACLGAPERYRAYYTYDIPGHALKFDMLYLDLGISVQGWQFFDTSQKESPPVTDEFPAMRFSIVVPGYWDNDDVYEEMLREYKPWPGNWEDIVIDIDPVLTE